MDTPTPSSVQYETRKIEKGTAVEFIDILNKTGFMVFISIAVVYVLIIAFPNSSLGKLARDNHNAVFGIYALLPAFMSLTVASQAVRVQAISEERAIIVYDNERRVGAAILERALEELERRLDDLKGKTSVSNFTIPAPLEDFAILKSQVPGLAAQVYLMVSNARRTHSMADLCINHDMPTGECETAIDELVDGIIKVSNDIRSELDAEKQSQANSAQER